MKKALIIIVIIIVVGAAAFGGLLFLKGDTATVNQDGTTTPNSITLRDFFPFGSDSKVNEEETPLVPTDITPIDTTPVDTTKPEQKLFQVYGSPVAGFGFAMVDVAPETDVTPEYVTVKANIVFKKDLALGKKDTEVKELQKLFNQCAELQIAPSGVGSLGKETTTFDKATESAVKIFQTIFRNIDPETQEPIEPTGKVDTLTRENLNVPFECTKPKPAQVIEKKEALRFVQKSTGHVYETLVANTNIAKLTNTTIPRVHEAIFIAGTDEVMLRYLDSKTKIIQSFIGTVATHTIGKDTGQTELKGTFLPENILDAVSAPTGGKLFYLTTFDKGSVGDMYVASQNKKTQIYTSEFSEWKTQFVNTNTILYTTRASARVPGFAYVLNTDSKTFTRLIGNINGLTTLMNEDNSKFVYGSTVGNDPTITLYDIKAKTRTVLPFTTIPSKCLWAGTTTLYCGAPTGFAPGEYPDVWYQGLVSFSDKIWKVDTETGASSIISDPIAEVGQELDAVTLKLDATGTKLFFINKKDSSLWSLAL